MLFTLFDNGEPDAVGEFIGPDSATHVFGTTTLDRRVSGNPATLAAPALSTVVTMARPGALAIIPFWLLKETD